MTLAALDPGSARCALVIAEPAPLALVHAEVFPVGHLELLPEPITITRKAGKTWTKTHKRVCSPSEETALITAIVSALLAHGVDRLLIEVGKPYLSDREKLAALRAQVREVSIANGIAKQVQGQCALLGIAVELIPRVTWLAALRRHTTAGLTPGIAPLPTTLGRTALALDPLLRHHLPALYRGSSLPSAAQLQPPVNLDSTINHPRVPSPAPRVNSDTPLPTAVGTQTRGALVQVTSGRQHQSPAAPPPAVDSGAEVAGPPTRRTGTPRALPAATLPPELPRPDATSPTSELGAPALAQRPAARLEAPSAPPTLRPGLVRLPPADPSACPAPSSASRPPAGPSRPVGAPLELTLAETPGAPAEAPTPGPGPATAPPAEDLEPELGEEGELNPGPRERSPGADLRDAAGLLLSRVLPCPAPGRAPRAGTARERGESRPKPDIRKRPSYQARLAEDRAKRAARRALLGCTCPPGHHGRHPRECPAHVPRSHVEAARARRERER